MSNSLAEVHQDLYAALNEMLAGDSGPVCDVWSPSDDISYAGPFGGFIVGRELVVADFERTAAMGLGGRIEISEVHLLSTDDMGYTVCTEHGINHIINGQPVNLTHRATNIFRREAKGWHLVHHHTDASSA